MDIQKFLEEIEQASVLELNELVHAIEEKFGVSAAAPVAVAGGAATAAAAPAEEEKTEFDVVLKSFGDKKLDVIKVVREATGLALMDAKKLVKDYVPTKDVPAIADKNAHKDRQIVRGMVSGNINMVHVEI